VTVPASKLSRDDAFDAVLERRAIHSVFQPIVSLDDELPSLLDQRRICCVHPGESNLIQSTRATVPVRALRSSGRHNRHQRSDRRRGPSLRLAWGRPPLDHYLLWTIQMISWWPLVTA
jgi:hypothetical protein